MGDREGSGETVAEPASEVVEEPQGEGVALVVEVPVALTLALRESSGVRVTDGVVEAVVQPLPLRQPLCPYPWPGAA